MNSDDIFIPSDILARAQEAWQRAISHPTESRSEIEIALALVRERERCARFLDECNDPGDRNKASSIRSGEQA